MDLLDWGDKWMRGVAGRTVSHYHVTDRSDLGVCTGAQCCLQGLGWGRAHVCFPL